MSQDFRVLVGDDDVNDRFFLEWGFKQVCPSVKVDFARDGQSVIKYIEENPPPSLLILDSMMPRVDGFAVMTWLRGKPDYDRLPVVMLSGNAHQANIDRAAKLGVKAYVRKPHDFPELVALIGNWKASYLGGVT